MWYVNYINSKLSNFGELNIFFFRISMFFVTLWWLIFLMTLMLMQTSKILFELFNLLINSYLFEYVAELLDTQIFHKIN